MTRTLLTILGGVVILMSSFIFQEVSTLGSKNALIDILISEGEAPPLHYIETIDSAKAMAGKEIFEKGFTTINGKKTKRVSLHYQCTSCHNNVREDRTLSATNPSDRLSYASEKSLPFLQGTTLYGTVNRTSWYNGDYELKYGDLVTPARDTLENAVQLCAEVCAQGRKLTKEELEVMMHYLWTLQYTLEDIGLTEEALEAETNKAEFIQSKYEKASPATFVKAITYEERKMGEGGNLLDGEVIYKQSCMHCHSGEAGKTNLKLNDDILSYKYLANATKRNSPQSIYTIVRGGTYPIEGYKPYMPHYTKERMSDAQVESLVAFILSKAKGNE